MKLLAALLVATLGAPAAEPAWPGGELSLGEACALLVAAGYPTSLDPMLDPMQRAELPLIAGGYWSAVLTIGEAFDCLPAPPVTTHRYPERRPPEHGVPVDVEGGAVVLIPRGRASPRLSAHGPLLVEVEDAGIAIHRDDRSTRGSTATAGVLLRLRLAPDLPRSSIGPADIDFHRIRGGGGVDLPWARDLQRSDFRQGLPVRNESQRRLDPLILVLPGVERGLTTIHLAATLRFDLLRSERFERLVHPGHHAPVELGESGLEVDLWLYGTEQAGTTPWQRPGVGLGFPPEIALGAAPRVMVSDLAGVSLRDFGQRSLSGHSRVHYTYLHQVGNGPYRISVELSLLDRRPELPLELTLHLP